MANYVQPDFRVPVTPGVSIQIEAPRNPLGTISPIPAPAYIQPDTAPRALAVGQLGGTKSGMLGTSKNTYPSGSVTNL
jgi:hypothetical protein